MTNRKSYSKDFKARVAIDALKGLKTTSELSSEYGVHTNQITKWKKTLTDEADQLFSRKRHQDFKSNEAEKDRLYQQIGKLQVELEWLKKTAR